MAKRLKIAWYNLENLFDAEDAQRDPKLKARLRTELKDWTKAVRDNKIAQLAAVIEKLFDGSGPDLLGVCEVENEDVLKVLAQGLNSAGRDYDIVSHESKDARGIDVSFIVDKNVFSTRDVGHQVVIKRVATRDLMWMTVKPKGGGPEFVAIANHWPARSGAGKQYGTEPFRMLTGETLAYVVSTLLADDPDRPIIAMGDFNDDPFNRSMQEYLLGTRDPGRVSRSSSGHMLNLMWPIMSGNDPGTYKFGPTWNMLDQFLVTKGFLKRGSPIKVDQSSVRIFRPDFVKDGEKPRPFGRPSKRNMDPGGYSDHFPICAELVL